MKCTRCKDEKEIHYSIQLEYEKADLCKDCCLVAFHFMITQLSGIGQIKRFIMWVKGEL